MIKCNTEGCKTATHSEEYAKANGWTVFISDWYCPSCTIMLSTPIFPVKQDAIPSNNCVCFLTDFWKHAQVELERADGLFPDFHSAHEAYAVLIEEVDEVWDCVRGNKPDAAFKEELLQVAAMCCKFARYIDERETRI